MRLPAEPVFSIIIVIEQSFLKFTIGVFFGGLHPTITHVVMQLSKDITAIVYQTIDFLSHVHTIMQKKTVSQLAYSREIGALKRKTDQRKGKIGVGKNLSIKSAKAYQWGHHQNK